MLDLKANFSTMYKNSLECSIDGCDFQESQEHLMTTCQPLLNNLSDNINDNIKYEDLFGSTRKQIKVTQLFSKLLEIRYDILNP